MPPPLKTLKERLSPIWASAASQLERGRQWLTRSRDPIDWKTVRTRANPWLLPNTIASRALAAVILAVVLVGIIPWLWQIYSTRFPAIIPLGAGIGGAIIGWAALTQAATARRRHEAQTGADLQRRITENFTKAVEQLGSDKLEVRLGGIYSLERISKESPEDYWTVMENLTAFVRERSRRNEAERTSLDLEQRVSRRAYFLWLEAGRPDGRAEDFWAAATRKEEFGEPATDIAAVLTVLKRRSEQSRKREEANDWHLDLRGAVLNRTALFGAHLEGANLSAAHLVGATLRGAHLEGAILMAAHLEGAILRGAHLEGTNLMDAHLEATNLLSAYQFRQANGDVETKLPEGVPRPAHWPGSAPQSAQAAPGAG